MANIEIFQFPCLDDNYGVLVHDVETGQTASIDAPDAETVRDALTLKGWKLSHIWTTHHHADHTAGNVPLKDETGCTIVGPRGEAGRVPGLDKAVGDGETFSFGSAQIHVLDTPGHTAGHVTYWIPAHGVAFAGDTLFSLGCGRIMEGTPEMMWKSLRKIMELPPATRIYCGHEYTLANGKFALTIEPDNKALQARVAQVQALRSQGQPTLPMRLDQELETNPFLRAGEPAIKAHLGLSDAPDWKVFAEIRARKNRF